MKIIFLGGIPGVGKTTLAYKLALKYNIDKVISLDILKNILKVYEKNEYLRTTTHEAYKIENLEIVEGFIKHSLIINNYFYKLIKNFQDNILIVEGATITQDFVNLFKDDQVCYLNLIINKREVLIKRYKQKLKLRKGKWLENIEAILKIDAYLRKQAKINIDTENLERVEKIINESLCL